LPTPIGDEERDRLFAAHDLHIHRLALAVSGGADSMALMHLVAGWWRARKNGGEQPAYRVSHPSPQDAQWPPIVVLTVDHGLRPQSADEAQFVADHARELGLVHRTLVWAGEKPESGIQEAARAARYRLMAAAIDAEASVEREGGAGIEAAAMAAGRRWLVTAHHQDDQAETFLMRLARGSGVDGLGCMRPCDTLSLGAEAGHGAPTRLTVVRPLLAVPKARLVATLEATGAAWLEDPSNDQLGFERVRIRKAFAGFAAVGLTAPMIARSAERIARAAYALDRQMREDLARHVAVNGGLQAEIALDALLPATSVEPSPPERLVRILRRVLATFGGSAAPASLEQVETLAELVQARAKVSVTPGWLAGVTLGGCRIAGSDPRKLSVIREWGRDGLPEAPLPAGHEISWDGGRFRVAAAADAPAGVMVRALGADGWLRLKQLVPALGDWRAPPAAVATLPAIWRSDELLAVPYFADQERRTHLPHAFAAEWRAAFADRQPQFSAEFRWVADEDRW